MHRFPAAAAPALLLMCGCGYVGDPLPPLANVPGRVTDLAAVQRSARIIVNFTPPARTTEGLSIRGPLRFDLRVGTAGGGKFSAEDWAARAKTVPRGVARSGLVHYELPSTDWTGREVSIAVRAIGANGKASSWSNFANLMVVPPPEKPASLERRATAQGVHLSWAGPAGTFRILRRADNEKQFTTVAEVEGLEWTDPNTEFGRHYEYLVQRIVKTGDFPAAESELSEEVEIIPKDEFPPAAPVGLRASAAPASVELSWDPNSEPDLAGYRVYRAEAAGEFQKIADVSQVPAYSDQKVEHGKTYRYAVTAVDKAGNESPRSAAVEATL